MSASRILPIINVAGCVIVTGLIVTQWVKERHTHEEIKGLRKELASSQEKAEGEQKRADNLQRDVDNLKATIEDMMKSKLEFEAQLAKAAEEHNTETQAVNASNQEQIQLWQKAITDRDEIITKLNSNLSATRARLDAAVAELKKAGAR